ncbi:CHAT domain-containing protein [Phormidesmis sp. 146-33]
MNDGISDDQAKNFLIQVLDAIHSSSDLSYILALLEANTDKIEIRLIQVLRDLVEVTLKAAQATSGDIRWIAASIAQFSFILLNLPFGDQETNARIAAEACEIALTVYSFENDYEFWYHRGKTLAKLGKLKSALKSYEQSRRCDLRFAKAWFDEGLLLQELGNIDAALGKHSEAIAKHEAAISSLRKASKLAPESPLAFNHLGNSLTFLGRDEEALSRYNEALKIQPDFVDILFNRARLQEKLGHYEEAIDDYSHIIELRDSDEEAWFHRGNLLLILNRGQEATNNFEHFIQLNPDSPLGWLGRGLGLLSKLGKTRDEISQQYVWTLLGIPVLSPNELNEVEDVFAIFYRAWELEPTNPSASNFYKGFYVVVNEGLPPEIVQEIAMRMDQREHRGIEHERMAEWLARLVKERIELRQVHEGVHNAQTYLIDVLNEATEQIRNPPRLQVQYEVLEAIQQEQAEFISNAIEILSSKGNQQSIEQLIENNLNLLTGNNFTLFSGSLLLYIYQVWLNPSMPLKGKLFGTYYINNLCKLLFTTDSIGQVNNLPNQRGDFAVSVLHFLMFLLGVHLNIWNDDENEHSLFAPEDLQLKLTRLEDYIVSFNGLDYENLNHKIITLIARVLQNLGFVFLTLLSQGKRHFIETNGDQDCAIQCLKTALKIWNAFFKNEEIRREVAYNAGLQGDYYFTCHRISDEAEDLEKAIQCYEKVLTILTPANSPNSWALAKRSLGRAYKRRERGSKPTNLKRALQYYLDILEVSNVLDEPLEKQALTHREIGNLYSLRHKYFGNSSDINSAIHHHSQAGFLFLTLGNPTEELLSRKAIIQIQFYESLKDRIVDAEPLIEVCKQRLNFFSRQDHPVEWRQLQWELGQIYLTCSSVDEGGTTNFLELAIDHFKSALYTTHKETDSSFYIDVTLALGEVYKRMKRYDEAYDNLVEAITVGEALRINLAEKLAIEEDKQKIAERPSHCIPYSLIVEVCIKKAFIQNKPEFASEALKFIERSKAQNLVNLLANRNTYPNASLYNDQNVYQRVCNRLDQLRREILAVQRQLELNESSNQSVDKNAVSEELSSRLQRLQTDRNNLLLEINNVDELFKYTQRIEPITFEQIHSLIGQHTAILEWYYTQENLYVFIIIPGLGYPIVYEYPQTSLKELGDLASEYRYNYLKSRKEWQNNLSNYLERFAGLLEVERLVETYIPSTDCQRLILVPHRDLHVLPIHALPMLGGEPLFNKFSQGISYAPSCQVLELSCKQQRTDFTNLLAIQDPNGAQMEGQGFPTLLSANLEVETISKLFPSIKVLAKDEAKKSTLVSYSYLQSTHCCHFACHGSFQQSAPLESALHLADGEDLTLAEIFALPLNQCRLVTLSACETGLIDVNSPSDEYIGLPNGFIYAGSPSVVSSLWKANDISTALLMVRFYKNLKQIPSLEAGSIPFALNEAQRWLRELSIEEFEQVIVDLQPTFEQIFSSPGQQSIFQNSLNRAKKRRPLPFAQPYYWAAFTTIGF